MIVDRRPSLESRLWLSFLRCCFGPVIEHVTPRGASLAALRAASQLPAWLRPERRDTSIRASDPRGLWLEADGSHGVILYVHGGGTILGSASTYLDFGRRLREASGLSVFLVDYALAPEHPYPCAPDDVLAAYQWLIGRGYDPSSVVVAGDSAGGTLVLHLLGQLKARSQGPAAAVLLSPGVDLTFGRAEARHRVRADPVIRPRFGRVCIEAFFGGQPIPNEFDVLSGDVRGWPPVLIQVGETECLAAEAAALEKKLTAAGVPCRLEVWPGQVHVFGLFGFLREAREAVGRVGRFAAEACAAPPGTGFTSARGM